MTPTTAQLVPRRWIKHYPNAAASPDRSRQPPLADRARRAHPVHIAIDDDRLEFAHVRGHHAKSPDLPSSPHCSESCTAPRTPPSFTGPDWITPLHQHRPDHPDFLTPRRAAVHTLLTSGAVPTSALTAAQALRTPESAAADPACLYKDNNPRSFLITTTRAVLVDFDVLLSPHPDTTWPNSSSPSR